MPLRHHSSHAFLSRSISGTCSLILKTAPKGQQEPRLRRKEHVRSSEERPAPQLLPTALNHQGQETLAQSNQERHDWIEQLGAQNREATTDGYQRKADLWMST